MESMEGEFLISDDKTRLSINKIHSLLRDSYWAAERTPKTLEKTVENSLCFGLYHREEQIGFARVVTDEATVFWLGDVIIDPSWRSRGWGKKLVEFVLQHPKIKGLSGLLGTKDAHELYRRFGFQEEPETLMRKPRSDS